MAGGDIPTRSLGIRWADIVALVQAYTSNNITEEHLAAALRAKLKPSGGWADADLAQAVRALLRRVGGFAHNNQAADVSTRQVSLAEYQLVNGVIVTVRFANDVPAGAKLQISGDNGSTYTAATDIYLGVSPIASGDIKGGMTVVMQYDGNYYRIISRTPEPTGSGGDVKPAEGWASTDLAQAVQDLLVLAGTAYQKASSGIPEADLASAVQNLLHLAGGIAANTEAADTTTRSVTISGYKLATGAMVTVRFSHDVPAGALLRVSPNGSTYTTEKAIYYGTSALTEGIIQGGMTVTFRYDGSYYRIIAMTPGYIAPGSITAGMLAAGVVPMWYFFAAETAYNAAASSILPGSYILIGDNPISLYRRTQNGKELICTWPVGSSGGDDPSTSENTQIITMSYYDGDTYASQTAAQIYAALQDGAVNFVLIDRAGRQCALIAPPEESNGTYTAARFFTLDDSGTGGNLIVYSINLSGIVSSDTIPIPSSSGGGGTTTLPELGGGYATASGGSTVAQTVTISGYMRTVGNGPTIKYTNEITAKNPTLNVNDGTDDTGEAAIWYCGSALRPGAIRAGALVKFVYDGAHYCVESIDGRPIIQLMPNQGVISISGTYQDLIAKLKGAAVPQIICTTPNTTMQNLELMELRHVWSNDTTSEIKLAGRVGGIEYYVVLTQSGSSGSEVMSGTLESCNLTPDVVMQSSTTPTIAIRNNELHDCGTVTRITISDWPADGDWGLEFTSLTTATELIWSGGSHPTWPDGMTSFVPETNTQYEINVHNGKALIGAWPV